MIPLRIASRQGLPASALRRPPARTLAPALARAILFLLSAVFRPGGADAAESTVRIEEVDFDRDGIPEQWESGPGTDILRLRKDGKGEWVAADFGLPEGLHRFDAEGHDTGLRLIDLNEDGFPDVLLSNAERYSVHLWNKDVKPHLGWVRGWSQFVRAGRRTGAPMEPPDLAGASVTAQAGVLVVSRPGMAEIRRSLRALIAIDMPPPLSPDAALASFRVPSGFQVELVAAEPVVVDSIAFDWGADGSFWVVEMRDYPLGLDGKGSPGGVIKRLVDGDGDGRYERAVVFLDGIPFPTSVMAWRRGLLVAAAPDIFYAEDLDGDGRADRREVLFTGFEPGNQQHRVNGFEWGLDGWIHVANGDSGGEVRSVATGARVSIRGRDLRIRPESGEIETVSVQTQYGRRRDDWGNWFGNNNPTWLWHVTVPEHYLRRNPRVAARRVMKVLANYPESTRVFPASPAQVRPNQPWSLNHVTSGSSASPYRDDLFGPEFATSVFICEPVHNVVHREVLERDGSGFSSRRDPGEKDREFLASTDNWFRPTMVRTGPDGALYVADMYRFVLEHPEWIAPEMLARLDLRAGTDKGRIYRVVPDGKPRRPLPNLTRLEPPALAAAHDHPGGWQRDTAQRLLVDQLRASPDAEALRILVKLTGLAHPPQVRVQSMATLGLLRALPEDRLRAMLSDPNPWVRSEALRQSEAWAARTPRSDPVFAAVAALARDGDAAVRVQAAFSLGAWTPDLAEPVLASMAESGLEDETLRLAVLCSLRPDRPLFAALNARSGTTAAPAVTVAVRSSSPDRAVVIAQFAGVERLTGNPGAGRERFIALCAPCHRFRGDGFEVGPDLAMVSGKDTTWLLHAILDPAQAIEARYRGWSVTLKSGDTLDGLIAAETANNLVLRMAGGVEHPVLRTDIAELQPSRTSLMPEGFESALQPQDMADLMAWLRGGGPAAGGKAAIPR